MILHHETSGVFSLGTVSASHPRAAVLTALQVPVNIKSSKDKQKYESNE